MYKANWTKMSEGNGITSGSTLTVSVDNASHISGGIYKDNLPVQIGFAFGPDPLTFKLSKRARVDGEWRTVGLALGKYVLKIRAYVNNRGQGWDDEFEIV